MSITALPDGSYIDSATGQKVDAQGRPLTGAPGTRPAATAPQYPGQNNPYYANATMTPQQWAQSFPAFNAQNPNFVNNSGQSQSVNDALHYLGVNDPQTTFRAQGLGTNGMPVAGGPNTGLWGKSYFDPTTGQMAVGATNGTSPYLDPAAYVGAGRGQPTMNQGGVIDAALTSSAFRNTPSVQALLPNNPSATYNNSISNADTAQYSQIANMLAIGMSPQDVLGVFTSPAAGNSGIGMQDIQAVMAHMQSAGIQPGSQTSGVNLGGTQASSTPPPQTYPVNPPAAPAAQTGTINPTDAQTMRANYMDSPQFNPYGTNTYGVQNDSSQSLQTAAQGIPGFDPATGYSSTPNVSPSTGTNTGSGVTGTNTGTGTAGTNTGSGTVPNAPVTSDPAPSPAPTTNPYTAPTTGTASSNTGQFGGYNSIQDQFAAMWGPNGASASNAGDTRNG